MNAQIHDSDELVSHFCPSAILTPIDLLTFNVVQCEVCSWQLSSFAKFRDDIKKL